MAFLLGKFKSSNQRVLDNKSLPPQLWLELFCLSNQEVNMINPCECGCGNSTSIAKQTLKRDRIKKGEYRRFIKGHAVMRNGFNMNWKGDKASPNSGRQRAIKKFKITICDICGKKAHDRHHKDLNCLNNDRNNILILCRKCHMVVDGRFEKFIKIKHKPTIGETNGMSKLKEENVKEIYKLFLEGFSQTKIGKIYGISQSNISFIVRGETWKYLNPIVANVVMD